MLVFLVSKMAVGYAWLSVVAKRGLKVELKSKMVQCNWENSFGILLQRADMTLQSSTVDKNKVIILTSDRFIDVHEVNIDAPVFICKQFNFQR